MLREHGSEPELAEWDLLVGLVLAQLTAARREHGNDDWLPITALERAVREVGRGGASAIQCGWARDAERRGLVERRVREGTEEVRVGAAAPEPLDPPRRHRRFWKR